MSDTSELKVDDIKNENSLNISLIGMLMVIISLALTLVGIAYFLYYISPQRKFDLARPGDPNKNTVVDVEDIQADTKTPVTALDAKNKLESFSKELKALSGYSSFDSADVSDQSIGLQSNDQPSL